VNALLSALADITQRLGHVASIVLAASLIIVGGLVIIVLAASLIIVGGLVIVNPALLGWMVGLMCILVGIAVLARIFTPRDRYR
jgi:hypothetical protein